MGPVLGSTVVLMELTNALVPKKPVPFRTLEYTSKFGFILFGTVWDTTRLYEQNRVLAINTRVLFYT